MSDKEQEKAIFTPRQSNCRTPPSRVSVVEEMPTTLATGKRSRESPGETQPPTRPPRDTERSETQAEVDVERSLRSADKEELIERVHSAVKSIFGVVTSPGSKLNKTDTNSLASHGQDILAVVAALNLYLAEAELATVSAKFEAARAVAVCGEQGPAQPAARSYASALKLPGPARASAEAKRPAGSPVLAFYPVAEQAEIIITAEETKKLLKSAMDPTSMQVQVTKAVTPTLRVTEPRSRRPLVALRNLSEDPSGEAVISGLFEQNLRIKHPDWTIERLRADDSRSRVESVKCQEYGHPEAHCRSSETVCSKCRLTGHRAADCKAKVARCATCHRFGRREADTHLTAARE
ncbi:hypothetical protein EVAR_14181_1 [Eumeta japonica]|uniref:CCHC-type domain-containing protein n=1 Tax=Eumeta variegata TaxID=151549 RepID=A0A4C1UEP3_EUMVA|nr:hypothetical protein EVAR_14181_1 [Eumeta japonica]